MTTDKALAFVGALLVLCCTGCDDRPKRYAVSGTVTIDGEPLKMGVIRFIPSGARASMSAIDDQGRFTMSCYEDNDGVIPGNHRVTINAGEQLSPTKVKWHAPPSYADLDASGLTATIDRATEDIVFELTWDGGKPYIENRGRANFEETSDDI